MPIKGYKQNNGAYSGKKYFKINLYSKKLSKKLIENYSLQPYRPDNGEQVVSKIPNIYVKDFIRGLLDGDGSIVTSTMNKAGCHLSFIGQKFVLDLCNKYINHILGTNKDRPYIKRHIDRDINIFVLNICGNKQIFYILDNLYGNSAVYLDRKYERYKEIYQYYEVLANTDVSTLSGKGSGLTKRVIFEMREYFNNLRKENVAV